MAKDISLVTGMGTDPDYINGNLVKKQTLASIDVHNDIVQLFQKLLLDAGITPNGNYDNNVNGYQLLEALVSKIRENTIIDRGDPSSVDFTKSSLTLDGSFRDLDLSSIIPTGAKTAILRVTITTSNTAIGDGGLLKFRKKGNTNVINSATIDIFSQSAITVINGRDILVSLDTGRVLEYTGAEYGNGMSSISITVAGWIF